MACWTPEKAGIIARAVAVLDPAEARAAEALVLGLAGLADPGRAAVRDRPRGDRGRAGEGAGAAQEGRAGRAGGTVARGVRERGAGRPGAAAGPR